KLIFNWTAVRPSRATRLRYVWTGPNPLSALTSSVPKRLRADASGGADGASRREVDRRQHNQHADDRVEQDARAVRSPGHDVSLVFHLSGAGIEGQRRPVCDPGHTFAHFGEVGGGKRRLPAGLMGAGDLSRPCRQNQRFAQIIALCAEAGATTVGTWWNQPFPSRPCSSRRSSAWSSSSPFLP